MPTFRPRGPIVSDPPRVDNLPPEVPPHPVVLPSCVVQVPPSRHEYGQGGGSVIFKSAPNIDATPGVVPAIVQTISSIPMSAHGLGRGSAIALRGTPVAFPPSPRPVVVVASRLEYQLPGNVVSARGGVNSVDTIPRVVPTAIVQSEPRKPHQGWSFVAIGGVDSGTLVARANPAVVTHDSMRIPPPGSVYSALGGVESGTLVARAVPAMISRQEMPQPLAGSVISAIGMVPSVDTTTPGVPAVISRAPRDNWPVPNGDVIVLSGWPQLDRLPRQVIQVQEFGPVPRTGAGVVISPRGMPESGSTVVPNRPVLAQRLDYPGIRHWNDGSVRSWSAYGFTVEPPLVIDIFDITQVIEDEFNIGDNGVVSRNQVVFVGDVRRIQAKNFTKDGAAWTITSATLKMAGPDGTVASYAGTSASSALWYYDTSASEISSVGEWRCYWVLSDGSVSLTHEGEKFTARDIV